MSNKDLSQTSVAFLVWLHQWEASLKPVAWRDLVAGDPARVAIACTDMVVGFCYNGPLSSPRVAGIVPSVVGLFRAAHAVGVQHYILPQDAHSADAIEFDAFSAHCVGGSYEAETIPELAALPFADRFTIVPKNSINPAIGTDLEGWFQAHPKVSTFVVAGDCSDICVYQLAMHLRMRANALRLRQRVVLPANCVQTYDLPVEVAVPLGILPHDGDLLHTLFLYSMALNGVEVVSAIVEE